MLIISLKMKKKCFITKKTMHDNEEDNIIKNY